MAAKKPRGKKAAAVPVTVAEPPKPTVIQEPPLVGFTLEYEDGSFRHANGKHAREIYRYLQECIDYATGSGYLTFVSIPPMKRFATPEQLQEFRTSGATTVVEKKAEAK